MLLIVIEKVGIILLCNINQIFFTHNREVVASNSQTRPPDFIFNFFHHYHSCVAMGTSAWVEMVQYGYYPSVTQIQDNL